MTRPSLATISSSVSKQVPSVVSLYGAQRAKVKKSRKAVMTRAPVLRTLSNKNYFDIMCHRSKDGDLGFRLNNSYNRLLHVQHKTTYYHNGVFNKV